MLSASNPLLYLLFPGPAGSSVFFDNSYWTGYIFPHSAGSMTPSAIGAIFIGSTFIAYVFGMAQQYPTSIAAVIARIAGANNIFLFIHIPPFLPRWFPTYPLYFDCTGVTASALG